MATNARAVVVYLRMAPQLREGLRDAANVGGFLLKRVFACRCSPPLRAIVRAFGGTAETGPTPDEELHELRAPRVANANGHPEDWKERDRHVGARHKFVELLQKDFDFSDIMKLVYFIDAECPWHYVEWAELSGPLWPEGRGPEHRRCVTPSASIRVAIGTTYFRLESSRSRISATVSDPRLDDCGRDVCRRRRARRH